MSNEIWAGLGPYLLDKGCGLVPDGDNEPWLSYKAISKLTGLEARTIQNKCNGLPRHPLGGYVKLSDLTAALSNAKATSSQKTRRKRSPRRK